MLYYFNIDKYFLWGYIMYQLYIKEANSYTGRELIGEYEDVDDAFDRAEEEVAKDSKVKYVIEKTSGNVNSYGELEVSVIAEN